jgi:YbbR domain-containing protein
MSRMNIFQRIVRHNIRLKILAVLLAVFSWYLVREETSYEQTINGIPLVVNPPPGWVMVDAPARVSVRFAGARADVTSLSDENVEVRVDMKEGSKASGKLKLAPRDVTAPPGVRVLRVEPTMVNVRIEKKA